MWISRIWNGSTNGHALPDSFALAGRNPTERWEILDILRASAALLVFAFHYIGLTSAMTSGSELWEAIELLGLRSGSLGTNLLLMLSGLLIALSVAKSDFHYPTFLFRRGVRVYLPYLVVLFAGFATAIAIPGVSKPIHWDRPLAHVLEQLVLLPGLFPDRPFLTVSWTLSYVVAGYLVVPLFAMAFERVGLPRILAWWSVFILCFSGYMTFGFPSLRMCYIPAGCLMYKLYLTTRADQPRRLYWQWLLLVLATAVLSKLTLKGSAVELVAGPLETPIFVFLSGLAGVTAVCVLALALADRFPLHYEKAPLLWLQMLGRRGYSFYLLHGPVTKCTVLIMSGILGKAIADWWVNLCVLALSLTLSVICTDILYNVVELPTVGWLQRNSKTFAARA